MESGSDSSDLADACYNTGHFCLKYNRYNEAIFYFKKSIEIFEKTGRKSRKNYSNSLYNIGLTYYKLGDYVKSINFFNYSIENDKHIFGDNSVILVGAYYAISVNYILMRDYEKAFDNIDYALKIAQLNPDSLKATTLADLYGARGFAYSSSANYDQARTNLEKAESYYDKLKYNDVNYINILDNLGTVNHFLGSKEKSYYYYEKGLKMAGRNFTSNAIDLINNYAIILGNDHLEKRGEMLLSDFLKKSQQYYGNNSRNYYLILRNYADYLREFKINNNLALRSYMQCFNYIKDHPWDKYYRDDIILGYSLSLIQNGDFSVALDSIQTLLFPERSEEKGRDRLINPWPDSLKADGRSIKILNTKYQILWSEYRKYDNIKLLEAAAGTAELIIGVLERIRLNIGEEESRLLLGDRYRDSYMDAISCLNECYIKTNNQHYSGKGF